MERAYEGADAGGRQLSCDRLRRVGVSLFKRRVKTAIGGDAYLCRKFQPICFGRDPVQLDLPNPHCGRITLRSVAL